ncbi:hypothetical protein K1719_012777 [Acacia pycnantha]|nr:hypothetical protein K1719_012777 [Acacia pycnantha]
MEELQRSFKASCLLSVSVVLLLWLNITARPSMAATQTVPIGVILDLNSILGRMINNSLALAIEEYYSVHNQTATKIDLIVKNVSQDNIFTAARAAVGWQSIVPIYEETEYGSHLLPCLSNVLKDMGVQMANVTAIASKVEGINSTLDKLKDMRTHVFLVHMSRYFGTELILSAGRKEMMGEGFAWILTQELSSLTEPLVMFGRKLYYPNQVQPENFTDYRSLRMDMQGALRVRPVDLNKIAEERKKIESNFYKKFKRDLSIYGWWAYHTIEALAMAVEKQGTENNGTKLGEGIRATNFTGISGDLDAIIGDITIVASRTKCVDFTLPYLDSSVAMVVRVKKTSTSKGILLKPFKWSLWLILGAIFVGATIIINALEIIRANDNSRFNNPFLVYKIDVMENFESTTARWMVILTSFLFILVMQVYTAKLTSILTQGTTNEPSFKDENEIKSSNVPVGYKKGSWVRGLLIDQIGLKDEQLKGLGSLEEYNEALSNGTVDAIFDETPYLILFLSRYKSRFMMTGTMYQTGGFSFAFPKKSGFTSHFSTAILNVTQEVEPYRVLMSQSSLPTSIEDLEFEDQNDIETSSLSISNIGGFYPVLISIVVAFLFGLFILNPSVIRGLSNLSQRLCPEFSAQTFKMLNPANPPNGQGHV